MIKANQVKQLRQKTGASMMECKRALEESGGDEGRALKILREKGKDIAFKKSERETRQGIIESYIHSNGKIGVLLELNCETDFVARNKEFKELAHDLAMHIAGMSPQYLDPKDIPEEVILAERDIYKKQFSNSGKTPEIIDQIIEGKIKKYSEEISLLTQPFVKNPDITVADLIQEKIAKLGENIKIGKFVRYEL